MSRIKNPSADDRSIRLPASSKAPPKRSGIALAILAAAISIAGPAFAHAHSGSWQIGNDTMHIYYDDLDMQSASGRAQLLRRIELAANRLCDADTACTAATIAQLQDRHVRMALADRDAVRLAGREAVLLAAR